MNKETRNVMNSPKYVQETNFSSGSLIEYQNVASNILKKDKNQRRKGSQSTSKHQNITNSKEVLIDDEFDMYNREEHIFDLQNLETNGNKYPQHDFELMCKCAVKDIVYTPKARFKQEQSSSQQNVVSSSRSCCSTPKLGEYKSYSQLSLDRRINQPKYQVHGSKLPHYKCDQSSITELRRNSSQKKIQSPEIINTHPGSHNFLCDSYGPENCAIKSYGYDKDLKNDDYGFRRGASLEREKERSEISSSRQKKRVAGDGMDSEIDEPELMFEPTDLGACRCPCDHVVYGPGYSCLQVVKIDLQNGGFAVAFAWVPKFHKVQARVDKVASEI
ncbi:hypothetical protein FQA39_LY07076 [Lamprigera yunnana]|nr:hypothetical protein FQA39_LY07076 [Lamprigera yunnana]